jgi:hypothetical protein
MSHSAEAKLHELRNKTTRQLVSLINTQLDRGLAFVRMMESEGADWTSNEDFAANAELSVTRATAWMTLLDQANSLDRRRLEAKLSQLRDALDRTRTSALRVHAAC